MLVSNRPYGNSILRGQGHFHLGKAIFIWKRALPLGSPKVYRKLLNGQRGLDQGRGWPPCNSRAVVIICCGLAIQAIVTCP